MKKTLLLLVMTGMLANLSAQIPNDAKPADTTRAAQIIDQYLGMVNFEHYKTDSILYVVSKIVERNHPNDTMYIYRWYQGSRKVRYEIWQQGKLEDGYYGDGINVFRKFRPSVREWAQITAESFYDGVTPLDIRGALSNWRGKGAEVAYAGSATYEGAPVDRIYVTSPGLYDRYYYFEKNTGLLFLVTEEDRLYGDDEAAKNAVRVDWRAWSEFTPVRNFMLPSVESYQHEGSIVTIHNSFQYISPKSNIFTEEYIKR